MAVAFNAVGGGDSTSNSRTASWSHTASGEDRYVIAAITIGHASQGTGAYTRSVTYGGVAMTSLGAVNANDEARGFVELFGLANPPTGAQTVSVSLSGGLTPATLKANSVSYTGVTGVSSAVTAFGSTNNPSVTVPSDSGQLVVATTMSQITLNTSTGTMRHRLSQQSTTNGNSILIHDAPGAAPSVVMSTPHQLSVSGRWAAIGVSLLGNSHVSDAALSVTATTTAEATRNTPGSAELAVTVTPTATGQRRTSVGASLSVTAAVTATAEVGKGGSALLSVGVAPTASARLNRPGAAALAIEALRPVTATVKRPAAANLPVTVTSVAAMVNNRLAGTGLSVTVTPTATAAVTRYSGASLVVPVAATATLGVKRTADVSLAVTVTATAEMVLGPKPDKSRLFLVEADDRVMRVWHEFDRELEVPADDRVCNVWQSVERTLVVS